ncbi:MAG TPA: hypothetical protein VKI65_16395 [Gemmataceae bacterium]|nr:hypothetical protein [Gemmataceae bacterium]
MSRPRISALSLCFGILFAAGPGLAAGPASSAPPLLERIKAVSREGEGNVEAAKAWKELVQIGPRALIDILVALDDADPEAANWLRSAVDAIAERALAANRPLPAAKLEAFVKDTGHSGGARRLAYEWLTRVDTGAPSRLLPGMLHDPGSELRRDAVAMAIRDAQKLLERGEKNTARDAFRKTFAAARDKDQVDLLAKELKPLGVEVNLVAHFGFIQKWLLIGPFDNSAGSGFAKTLPPEKRIELSERLEGKKGMPLRWSEHTTTDPYGTVDLNKALGKHMGVIGYGYAAVESPSERPVELRATSNNAVKIFLNGREIFFREEYHHGMRMDQHVGKAKLKAGRNEILIKVCQNEQKEDWAQNWSFQLRVCDALGGAVPLKLLAEKPTARPVEGGGQ